MGRGEADTEGELFVEGLGFHRGEARSEREFSGGGGGRGRGGGGVKTEGEFFGEGLRFHRDMGGRGGSRTEGELFGESLHFHSMHPSQGLDIHEANRKRGSELSLK